MEDARGEVVEFPAFAAKFDKTAGKPGKLVFEVGVKDAAHALEIVGHAGLLTFEHAQTAIPVPGPGEGQTSFTVGVSDEERARRVEAAASGADPETGEVLRPVATCNHFGSVPSCPIRSDSGVCSEGGKDSVEECIAAAMPVEAGVEFDMVEVNVTPGEPVDGEEIPLPVAEDVPFLPADDDDLEPESAGLVTADLDDAEDAAFEDAAADAFPSAGVTSSIEAKSASSLWKNLKSEGVGTVSTPEGVLYELSATAKKFVLNVTGARLVDATADSEKIGVVGGVSFRCSAGHPDRKHYEFSADRPQSE
jgi:hypothetical protein